MAVIQPHSGSFDGRSVVVIVCSTLALYNALELILLIFTTFKRWNGLYFWSLLVASFGVIPYTVGFLIVFFQLTENYVGFIIDSYGWITLITGQSVVLYSRLHLVQRNPKVLRAVLWMIITDAIIFHIPTTVVLFGSSFGGEQANFNKAWTVIEKVQMTGFCIQEFIISGIYIVETVRLLQIVSKGHTRRTMWQLFVINLIIVALDIALLVVEYRDLRVYEQTFKGVIYSIKLKLEFAILGKLVQIVHAGGRVLSNAMGNTAEYVDETRSPSDVTRVASPSPRKESRPLWMKDIDEVSTEHLETTAEMVHDSTTEEKRDMADGRVPRSLEEMLDEQPKVEPNRRRTGSDSLYADMLREISR